MPKSFENIVLPSPSPGTTRTINVHRYGVPGSRPKVYLQAALHADEWPGLLTLHHLIRRLDEVQDSITGEIVVVPYANPIGLGQQLNGRLVGRYEFDGGGNFNRNFPDLAELAAPSLEGRLGDDANTNVMLIRDAFAKAVSELPRNTELETLRATLLENSITADMVLDLHCDSDSLIHTYASDKHRKLAAELGAEIGASVVLLEEDAGSFPFDDANAGPWIKLQERFGDNVPIPPACFATTVELRGTSDVFDHLAESDAANLFRFLQRQGVIAGDPGPLCEPLCEPTPLDGVDVIAAPAAGIVAFHKQLGERIEKGEVIAELVDLCAEDPLVARTPIICRTEGILFARMLDKLMRPGNQFCKVAGSEKLPHRRSGHLLET